MVFGRKPRKTGLSPEQEARIRAIVREELTAALHENGEIRYIVLQGARAEAWTLFGRLMDDDDTDPRESRMCHFCPFRSTPVAVAEHEAEHHGATGPLP